MIVAVAMATIICLVLSSFSLIAHSQVSNVSNFTLPCTITTTGNAWDGYIAFDLAVGTDYYFVVMDTNGTVLALRENNTSYGGAAYNIAPDTLMFEGEPQVDGSPTAPTFATHFWNLSTDATEDFPNVISEHDIQYDPVNNTFLTLQQYIQQVGSNAYLVDEIFEVDPNGNVLWTWNAYDHIPLSEASPFNETAVYNGQTVIDFTHANSLDWDYNDGIIYLNCRATCTFYKINETSGDIIWACGKFGNFTFLDANGQPLPAGTSLFYGEHNIVEVAPDVFTLFNNDYDNVTNPDDCQSSLMEITLNEQSMTATVNYDWQAPTAYWNEFAGANVLLPNGDFLGDFGDPSHEFQQNSVNGADQSWGFTNTGAVFVEVNSTGQVVRTWTFPVGCYVYRVETVTDPSSIIFASSSAGTPTPTPTPTTVTIIPPSAPVITQTPTPISTSTPTSVITSTPTPISAPSSSALPSSTPLSPINSQAIIASAAIVSVVVVVVLLAVIFYMRKRISNHKIDEGIKDD